MSRGEEPTPDSGLCEESLSVRVGRAGGWGLNGFGGFPGKYCDPPGLGGRGRLQERRNWGASAGVQVTGDEGLNQEKAVGTGRINKGRRQCRPVPGERRGDLAVLHSCLRPERETRARKPQIM